MSSSNTLFAVMTLLTSMTAYAQTEPSIKARNVVAISENLVTAGQPSAESLAELSKFGFKAVINLAPPTVPDAVANEAQIISNQGMTFIGIPVQWANPTEADFLSFVEAMKRHQGQKVLVHCQANMRASAMTFLYRVIVAKENPALAYEKVLKVWAPKDQWKEFINSQLKKANISFELQ